MSVRVGTGFDLHRLVPGRKCVLGGVQIPHPTGPLAHSDGDAVLHAIADARGADDRTVRMARDRIAPFSALAPRSSGAEGPTIDQGTGARATSIGASPTALDRSAHVTASK